VILTYTLPSYQQHLISVRLNKDPIAKGEIEAWQLLVHWCRVTVDNDGEALFLDERVA
jgi:hypothetical protein